MSHVSESLIIKTTQRFQMAASMHMSVLLLTQGHAYGSKSFQELSGISPMLYDTKKLLHFWLCWQAFGN